MDLPMPNPTNASSTSIADYKVLSFDVYGSLIEYKAHILAAFQPLILRLPSTSLYRDSTRASPDIPNSATTGSIQFLRLFQKQEDAIKLEKPVKRFDEILSEIWRRIARELDVETSEKEAKVFGSEAVIALWPCFAGTLDALKALSQHYRLVALSNIDSFAWDITSASPVSRLGEVSWWKVFTSEDFGNDVSRADEAKLETLINYCTSQGIEKEEILHVAQSLGHDHYPAKMLGLDSAWLIGDGPLWGKRGEMVQVLEKEMVGYKWKSRNLEEFAALVQNEWAERT